MRSLHVLLGPSVRLIGEAMEHLRRTLELLREKLRLAVASSVGQTVGGVVEDLIRAIHIEPLVVDHSELWRRAPSTSPSSFAAYERWMEESDEQPFAEAERAGAPRVQAQAERTGHASTSAHALAVGLHTALSWLRQGVGRRPMWTAVGIGLLSGLAVYAGGPLAAAGIGLAGSALGLVSLSETVRAVADGLAALRSS